MVFRGMIPRLLAQVERGLLWERESRLKETQRVWNGSRWLMMGGWGGGRGVVSFNRLGFGRAVIAEGVIMICHDDCYG